MKEIANAIHEEIKKTEEKLASLRKMEAEMNRISGISAVIAPKVENNVSVGKVRRKLKYRRFSDVEQVQIIRLWNSMSDLQNVDMTDKMRKIATLMNLPYKKIYNKVYWLMKAGKIKKEYSTRFVRTPVVSGVSGSPHRKENFYWSPEQTNQLVNLVNERNRPIAISKIMGIDRAVVARKIGKMRIVGKLPRAR
jgi:hypothetical protein